MKTYTSDLNEYCEGTDSNVYVILNGSKGNTRKEYLNLSSDEFNSRTFLPGSQMLFTLNVDDIGELKSLLIGHDGSGLAENWHLNKVSFL